MGHQIWWCMNGFLIWTYIWIIVIFILLYNISITMHWHYFQTLLYVPMTWVLFQKSAMMFIGIVLKLQPKLVMILRKGLCTRCDGSFGCGLPTKLVKIYMWGDIPLFIWLCWRGFQSTLEAWINPDLDLNNNWFGHFIPSIQIFQDHNEV